MSKLFSLLAILLAIVSGNAWGVLFMRNTMEATACGTQVPGPIDGMSLGYWGSGGGAGASWGGVGRVQCAVPTPEPGGTKYLEWNITGSCANNAGTELDFSNVTITPGQTYYMGSRWRFQRVNGLPIWDTTLAGGSGAYIFDKLIEMSGTHWRWGISAGWNGWFTAAQQNRYTYDVWFARSVMGDLAGSQDHFPHNVAPYSSSAPYYVDYENWTSIVIEILAGTTASTGRVRLHINGTKVFERTMQTSFSDSNFGHMVLSGTIAQGSGTNCGTQYNSPPHIRQVDSIIVTDSLADLQALGLMGGAAPVPVAGFTCTPLNNIQAPTGTTVCTDTSTESPTSWSWTTTRCGSSTAQNPTFTCSTGGLSTVCLTATNASGPSTQFCRTDYVTSRYRKPTNIGVQ